MVFLTALLVAYSAEWLPSYVSFLSPSKIQILGSLRSYEEPCTAPQRERLVCKNAYLIPREILNSAPVKAEALGIGMLLSATEVFCEGQDTPSSVFGDLGSASRALELQSTYQSLSLERPVCQGDILVKAWSPPHFQRSGHIGGRLAVGESNSIALLKRTVEFFAADLYLILSILLLICFLVQRLILKPALLKDANESEWRSHATPWVAFSIMKSGLLEILFPVASTSLIFIRISNIISLMAHTGPVLALFSASPRTHPLLRKALLQLERPIFFGIPGINALLGVLVTICLTSFFAQILTVWGLSLVVFAVYGGSRDRKISLTLFGVCLVIECLKLQNLPYAPHGSLTLLFVTGLLLLEFRDDLRKSAAIGGVLNWWRSVQEVCLVKPQDAAGLLKSFATKFDVNRVTLLEPHPGGSARLIAWDRSGGGDWVEEQVFLDSVPHVFSKALTSQSPLWNIDEKSELAYRLRKGQEPSRGNRGRYFSVIPVCREGEPFAAFALTGYRESLLSPKQAPELAEFAVQLMGSYLAELLRAELHARNDEWYRLCSSVGSELNQLSESISGRTDVQEYMAAAAALLSRRLESGVLFARVHPNTRELDLKVTSGFSSEVENLYQETNFYASSENIQGPMPVAVNENRIVTVSDLSWLKGVLHARSLEIFRMSGAKSAAALPIGARVESKEAQLHEAASSSVWGVLWIESGTLGHFNSAAQAGLNLVVMALQAYVARAVLSCRAHQVLSDLARPDIAEKLLSGHVVMERDHGLLLMSDIRGSTNLATRYGAEAWKSFMKSAEPEIRKIAEHHGFVLQLVVWDACFFTASLDSPNLSSVLNAKGFGDRLNECLRTLMASAFPEVWKGRGDPCIRLCVEFGDTTRDILNGVWTISGSAMAAVHKLEAACKNLPGWLFFTEVLPCPNGSEYQDTGAFHPASKLRIISLQEQIAPPL